MACPVTGELVKRSAKLIGEPIKGRAKMIGEPIKGRVKMIGEPIKGRAKMGTSHSTARVMPSDRRADQAAGKAVQ